VVRSPAWVKERKKKTKKNKKGKIRGGGRAGAQVLCILDVLPGRRGTLIRHIFVATRASFGSVHQWFCDERREKQQQGSREYIDGNRKTKDLPSSQDYKT